MILHFQRRVKTLPFSIFSKYKQVLISVISPITFSFSKTSNPTIKRGPLYCPGLSPQNEFSNPTGNGFLFLSSYSLLSPREEPNHTSSLFFFFYFLTSLSAGTWNWSVTCVLVSYAPPPNSVSSHHTSNYLSRLI